MVGITLTKSGLWAARKVIPADVRESYRSPHDGKRKREEKKTWPAGLTKGQAKAECAAWLAPIEDCIERLRSSASQVPVTLSQRQCRALAGEWYRKQVARFEDNPGQEVDWWFSREGIEPLAAESGQPKPPPFLAQMRDDWLTERGLKLAASSAEALLQDMGDLWPDLCSLMERRARGDYGADPVQETLPPLETAPQSSRPATSITGLFDEYVSTGMAAPATVKKWRGVVTKFVDYLCAYTGARVRGFRQWRWHLVEVFVKINGERHYLWRAVDHEGEILESYVT